MAMASALSLCSSCILSPERPTPRTSSSAVSLCFLPAFFFPVMLFINFSSEIAASFKYKYRELAVLYKGESLSFLMANIEVSSYAIKQYGVKDDQIPFIILLSDMEPDEISAWLKKYKNGELEPYIKSEPIPEQNDEPVKVVVAHTFLDIFLNLGKNVLLEFYARGHKDCRDLAPIFDDLAISYQSDPDVIIAKFDIF